MRNKKLFLALLALFASLPLWAYDFKVDGVAYNIISVEEHTVEVTKGDNNAFYSGNVVIPPTVKYEEIYYTVTAIGSSAFRNSPMISISLPTTLRVIKGSSFSYCYNLKSLTIPEGVETIKGWAIDECKQLQEVSFPSTMIDFCEYNTNFAYCYNLKTITVAKENPRYDSRNNCNAIVETARNTIVSACSGTTIPLTIRALGNGSFAYIHNDSLSIPESLKLIDRAEVKVSKVFVKDWETWCDINFKTYDYYLYNMYYPIHYGELYVGGQLIEGDVSLPNTVKSVGCFECYNKIESIHIPSSVKEISLRAFTACENLKTVTIDDGATRIGSLAFMKCTKLHSVILPTTMKEIGDKAFNGCTNLKTFRIPANVESIGSEAFVDCQQLAIITVDAKKIPTISDNTFSGDIYANAILYVPSGMKSFYEKAEGWKNFQNIIEGEEPNENINMYFEADGLYYHVTSVKDREVEVVSYETYMGRIIQNWEYEIINDSVTTEIVIPAQVTDKENGLTYTVTRLDDYINKLYVNARSIRIPNTVKEITKRFLCYFGLVAYTFNNYDIYIDDLAAWCNIKWFNIYYNKFVRFRNLYLNDQLVTNLKIPDGVTSVNDATFMGFQTIKSVTFAPSVESIGAMAFEHTSLEKVVIPATVKRIGVRAFEGCFDLKDLIIENGVSEIGAAAFGDCLDLPKVSIPASVKMINNFVFRCCKSLKELTLADGIAEIGDWAFVQCEDLESVTVPRSVKTIGRYAFNGCESLKNIHLSEGLENIDRYAFTNCSSLKSLHIPASVSYIGRNVVEDCPNLHSLSVANNNPSYDSRNGGNLIYETATNTIVAVTPNAAIPMGVDSIGDYAFAYCSDRQSVTLPEGVKVLGNYAFLHCWSLHTITIPASVSKIGYRTFDSCEGFESVVVMSEEPCQMNDESFTPGTYKRAILYVPDGTEERYRNAEGWKNFAQIKGHTDWQLGIEPVADHVTEEPMIKVDKHRVLLSYLNANERISVYRLDGTLVKVVNAAPDGKAILMLPEGGMYVIRTQTTAKKVTL